MYHEESKLHKHNELKLGEKIDAFFDPYIIKRATQPFKKYPGNQRVFLTNPKKANLPDISLLEVLKRRRSKRNFDASYSLTNEELSTLFKFSYGVVDKASLVKFDETIGLRPVPSPGGLYSLEIYLVLFRGESKSGLYHFRPDEFSLELIKEGDFLEDLKKSTFAQAPEDYISNSCGMILITGVYERLAIKYGDRAYRFMLHESGFVSQNISLILDAQNLGSCMVGGYFDDEINSFIGIDGVFETVHNIILFGKEGQKV